MKKFILLVLILITINNISCNNSKKICSDVKNFTPCVGTDPLFSNQWHLLNTEINAQNIWNSNITGKGVTIAIVDNGLDSSHEDLFYNVLTCLNYNYSTKDNNINIGNHGTSVAGISSAVDNCVGGIGVAPSSNIVGYNLIENNSYTTSELYDAMTRDSNTVDISNNSWGPNDNGQLHESSPIWQNAINDGISQGRSGKGTIYVWAAGNGGKASDNENAVEIDNSNYDGYANYYGVIAIGAITNSNERAYFSEKGSNLWVVTYGTLLTTTDVTGSSGYSTGNYTSTFSGTSASAPLASGIIALMLQANPNLTWRDVKRILAETAIQIDNTDQDWATNAANHNINHKYGFGAIDADAAVEKAKIWNNDSEFKTFTSTTNSTSASIPDNDSTGIEKTLNITNSGISNIEYVDIHVNITHPDSGNLKIILTSPQGTESILAEKHECYDTENKITSCNGFTGGNSFRFGTARLLDEDPNGEWKLKIIDNVSGDSGTLNSWSLKIYGR